MNTQVTAWKDTEVLLRPPKCGACLEKHMVDCFRCRLSQMLFLHSPCVLGKMCARPALVIPDWVVGRHFLEK